MILFVLNIWGWILSHAKLVLTIFAIVGVLIVVMLINRACNKPPKLDEKAIQKAEQAIKERNNEKLKDILAESDAASDNIDSTILQAEQRTREAKKSYDGLTTDELAAEIERRKQ